jgi:phosphatidate cytidylyltransferase
VSRPSGEGTTASRPAQPPGRSLTEAVLTAIVLLALVAVFYALGRPGFFILIVVVVSVSLFEMLHALTRAGHRPNVAFGLACGLGLMITAYAERPAILPAVVAGTVAGALLLALRPDRGTAPFDDAAWTVLGVAWIGGGGAAATLIMMLDPGGLELLIAFVLVAALDDIGAFFVGTSVGRHKLAPSISPAKSWEGFAGGLVFAVAGGAVAGTLLDEISSADGLAIGAICGLLAPVGDLTESMFKREIGIKDSGTLLPGHGGLLDRLDAIVFCAPAVFVYLRFVVF